MNKGTLALGALIAWILHFVVFYGLWVLSGISEEWKVVFTATIFASHLIDIRLELEK